MKILTTILILTFACNAAFSQTWHSASDTLKYPVKLGASEASMGWVNQYDTIACSLKMANSNVVKGYKLMLLYNGYFIDNQYTLHIFYDDRKQRLNNVAFYSYN